MSFLRYIRRIEASNRRLIGSRSGVILIGLVLTMVVFAILGAAILPMFSAATMNEVSANLDHKAYYMAESGFRYAASQYLHGGASGWTGEQRDDVLTNLDGKNYSLSGQGGSFQIGVESFFYKTASATSGTPFGKVPTEVATAASTGLSGRLAVYNSSAQNFNLTTYTGYSVAANRSTISFTGSALSPVDGRVFPVASLTTVVNNQPMPSSIVLGATDDLSLFPAQGGAFRIMTTSGALGTIAYTDLYYYKNLDRNTRTLSGITNLTSTGATSVTLGASERVVIQRIIRLQSTGTAGDTASNIFANRSLTYTLPVEALPGGVGGGTNPLNKIPPEDFIKTGATASGQFDVVSVNGNDALNVTQTTGGSSQGNQPSVEAYVSTPSNPSPFYVAWNAAGGYLSYDAQVKIATGVPAGGAFANRPATYATGMILRAKNPGQQETYYGVSFVRTNDNNGNSSDGIADTMIPSGQENRPMIMLWTRNGNQANGDDHWLAYDLLDTGGTDYAVDNTSLLKPWSTILVRVLEAGSIKLTGTPTPAINVGDRISGGSGTAKATVIRQIKDSDNNIVLLLNNIDAGFTRPGSVRGASTSSSWGFRQRDNYIWVFYGDTSAHGSDSIAVNNVRLGNPRNLVGLNDSSYALYWPVTNVDSTEWVADKDYFTLVQWSATLNTAQDADIRRMGGTTGKEAYGIIRTNKWTDAGPYTATTFPPEFGLHSLGKYAVNTYFDDIAFYLYGSLGGGGQTGFYPGVVEQ